MDDKIKVRCPTCTRVFREKFIRLDGMQVNRSHCNRLITFARDTEDPFLRKAMKTAKELRVAKDAEASRRTLAQRPSEGLPISIRVWPWCGSLLVRAS